MSNKKLKSKILSQLLSLIIIFPLSTAILQNVAATSITSSVSDSKQQKIHGFLLKKTLYFEGHPIFQYQHEKSGAWVIVEKNNDIDKKFEISVRTPPENDKGINHIIEHCVLNGSREYPCKNIIWELSKAAYSTFINAMTTPVYTTYPVSSTDEDELESLAKIYTSGVFHPSFLEDEKIFKKEGIRYEQNEEGNLQANGTVFNEMQQDNATLEKFLKRMFPDTQGGNLSGGLPKEIMSLSYSELCNTYKKYYQPSNMLIHLTGNINYEKFFKWIDEDYLSKYENQNTNSVQYLHQNYEKLKKYETSYFYKKSSDKNIINVSVAYIIPSEFLKENSLGLDVLSSIMRDPNSPRNKFLKEKGYLNIELNSVNVFYDPLVVIDLFTDKPELTSQEAIEKILDELFNKYPITQAEIDQVLSNEVFEDKLTQSTQLYENNISTDLFLMSFIRFNDPCSPNYFCIDEKGNISNESESDITEKNINKSIKDFLTKDKQLITVFLPSNDSKLSNTHKIEEKLKLLEPQKENLTKNYEEQKKWAESESSPENINMIKGMLKKLCNINTPDFKCPINVNVKDGKKYYQSVQEIGDFISYKFIFKTNHISNEDKKYLELLFNSFNFNKTKNYDRKELEKQKSGKSTNGLYFRIYENSNNEKNAFLILDVVSKKDNLEETIKLLKEQINNIDFKDKSTLKEFLRLKNAFYESASKTSLEFKDLVITKNLYKTNYLSGVQTEEDKKEFYKEFSSNIDNDKFLNTFSQKAEDIKNKILNQNCLEGIGICASKNNQDLATSKVQDFLQSLSNKKIVDNKKLVFDTPKEKSVAFIEPSQSNSEVICILDSKELSHDINFNSTCVLLQHLFLLPTIREKNGAYGASITQDPYNDKIIISSTQDPNIRSTINIFRSIPEFIEKHEFSDDEIENASKRLLGSLFQKDKLGLADNQTEKAVCQKIDHCGVLNENIAKIKKMSREKIKEHGKILKNLINNMRIYVVSGKIKESDKKMFDLIIE